MTQAFHCLSVMVGVSVSGNEIIQTFLLLSVIFKKIIRLSGTFLCINDYFRFNTFKSIDSHTSGVNILDIRPSSGGGKISASVICGKNFKEI